MRCACTERGRGGGAVKVAWGLAGVCVGVGVRNTCAVHECAGAVQVGCLGGGGTCSEVASQGQVPAWVGPLHTCVHMCWDSCQARVGGMAVRDRE